MRLGSGGAFGRVKAIDVLDETGARVRLRESSILPEEAKEAQQHLGFLGGFDAFGPQAPRLAGEVAWVAQNCGAPFWHREAKRTSLGDTLCLLFLRFIESADGCHRSSAIWQMTGMVAFYA